MMNINHLLEQDRRLSASSLVDRFDARRRGLESLGRLAGRGSDWTLVRSMSHVADLTDSPSLMLQEFSRPKPGRLPQQFAQFDPWIKRDEARLAGAVWDAQLTGGKARIRTAEYAVLTSAELVERATEWMKRSRSKNPPRASFAWPWLADAYYRRVGEVGKRLRHVADRRRQMEESRQWGSALLASMMRLPTFPFALRDPKAWWNRV